MKPFLKKIRLSVDVHLWEGSIFSVFVGPLMTMTLKNIERENKPKMEEAQFFRKWLFFFRNCGKISNMLSNKAKTWCFD